MVNMHELVPKHTKLKDSEKNKVLEKYNVSANALPRISKDDPAIEKLNVTPGDVIKIERESQTAGVSIYYRVVVEGWKLWIDQY